MNPSAAPTDRDERPAAGPASPRPGGFTLVELLAAVAIIALLVALLMPAIQAARESARRTRCGSNLRQIGVGLLTFESANGRLPPGTLSERRFSDREILLGRSTKGYEWPYLLHFILPNLELEAYYDALDGPRFGLQNPWVAPAGWPTVVRSQDLHFLRCPSDRLTGMMWRPFAADGSFSTSWTLPKSNYLGIFGGLNDNEGCAGSAGSFPQLWCDPGPPRGRRAAFRYNVGMMFSQIRDGASSTMAMSEYLTGTDNADARGVFYTHRAGCMFLYTTIEPNSTVPDNLLSHDNFCPADGRRHRPELNLPCVPGDHYVNFAGARSHHPGAVGTVFCDGSVRFIDDGIALGTWRNLGFIDDGPTTGEY